MILLSVRFTVCLFRALRNVHMVTAFFGEEINFSLQLYKTSLSERAEVN